MGSATPSQSLATDRAGRPGRSRYPLVITGIFAVLLAAFGYGIYGLAHPHRLDLAQVASRLPKQQLDHSVDRTVVGTFSHPALTIVGDYVEVKTPEFSALALVTGPFVPGEGLPDQMSYTTCTWTISFSHVIGKVPLAVTDFDSIDHLGTVFRPYLVPGQAKLPMALLPGHDLSFEVRAVMPVGEGLMRWAPDGQHIVAKWDYQVEND